MITDRGAGIARSSILGLVALMATLAAACSPINLQSAMALGNTGVKTSTAYQQAVTALSPGLDNFLDGQYMLAALQPEKYLPPTDQLKAGITQIQKALAARAVLLGQLNQVYTSFVALASYDASGQVKSGLEGLDGGINAYAQALSVASPPISPVTDAAIGDAGGLIASEAQKHQVLKASEAIVPRLQAISTLLAQETSNYSALQDEITRGLRDTALALWAHGIGAPDGIIRDQIGAFGLTYVAGSYAHACGNGASPARAACQAQFTTAVRTALTNRAARLAALQGQSLASNQTALAGLIGAHQALEHGKPLDLTSITAQLATIRGVIDDLNTAQKSKVQ
jgi:hypothetical protein